VAGTALPTTERSIMVARGSIPGPLSDVTDRILARTKSGTTIDVRVLAKLSEACYDMQTREQLGW